MSARANPIGTRESRVADRAAAEAIAAGDPYAKAGLFESVEIRAFRCAIGEL